MLARCAAVLLFLALGTPSRAQNVAAGPEPDRRATTLTSADAEGRLLAAVSISYTAATWRPEHEAMLAQLRGAYMRLGKGWWTTFDTIGTVEIGGVKVAAGSYYLGLHFDERAEPSLLLFDSGRVMRDRLMPSATPLYRGEVEPVARAPMTLAKDAAPSIVEQLELELAADAQQPGRGSLTIRWGRHVVSAPIAFDLGSAQGAAEKEKK